MSSNTDFRALGRLGTATGPLSGGTLRRTWSPRRGSRVQRRPEGRSDDRSLVGRVLLAALAVVLLLLFYVGINAGGQVGDPVAAPSTGASVDPDLEATLLSGATTMVDTGSRTLIPGGGAVATLRELPNAFAAMENVALRLPADTYEGVVFGEADSPDALPLAPVGTMAATRNPTYEPVLEAEGPDYAVMAGKTGVRPATGMAMIMLNPGTPVVAPIDGEVIAVSQYETEGGVLDWRVVISPSSRPDLHVVLRGLDSPAVASGQRVDAGETRIATVTSRPSALSEENPLALPSVLLTLRPALSDDGFDPFAPAVSVDATATS